MPFPFQQGHHPGRHALRSARTAYPFAQGIVIGEHTLPLPPSGQDSPQFFRGTFRRHLLLNQLLHDLPAHHEIHQRDIRYLQQPAPGPDGQRIGTVAHHLRRTYQAVSSVAVPEVTTAASA